jgi:hypothetical protein
VFALTDFFRDVRRGIKKSAAPKNAAKNFDVLKPLENNTGESNLKISIGTGAVVCMMPDVMPIDKTNWYVPAWII